MGIAPLDSPAIRFEAAFEAAGRRSGASAAFAAELDALAVDLDGARPKEAALIGLDRPVTLHVAPLFSPFDAGLTRLLEVIRARPWERHLVLLTGQGSRVAELQDRIADAGGAALAADQALGAWDGWLWLMAKLDAIAAQRVMVHLSASDLSARLALRLLAPVYGARLYLLQPAGLAVDLLPRVTHLVDNPAARHALRAQAADQRLRVGVLSAVFRPSRKIPSPDLPDPPPLPGPGRRAAVHWRIARVKWRLRWLRARVERRLARSHLSGLTWRARVLLARMQLIAGSRDKVTVTAGCDADLGGMDADQFAAVLIAVVRTTGGKHVHLGQISAHYQRAVEKAFSEAGLKPDSIRFQPGSRLTEAFRSASPGLLLELPARADAVTQAAREAQWLGMPTVGHVADATAETVAARAQTVFAAGLAARFTQVLGGRRSRRHADPSRFARRLNAIIAATEGRLSRAAGPQAVPMRDDLAALFDAPHYLGQLPPSARASAAKDPLGHYLTVGEGLGHHPHPLFDPRLAERSMAQSGGAGAEWPVQDGQSVLARYLASGGGAQPHQFFDPEHYLRQLTVRPETAVLQDFLDRGLSDRISPHSLIEPGFLAGGKGGDFGALMFAWLRGEAGFTASSYPLFDAGSFLAGDANNRLRHAAPNLLWAHLIEGNLTRRRPHLLIWPEEIEKQRPGTLVSAVSVTCLIAQNRLGSANTHPLVDTAHILSQCGWLAQTTRHPLRHYLESGVAENFDPHPWFSTQFYLYANPDVARSGMNPLLHYLRYGATEGRQAHAFFNGAGYYQTYLKAHVLAGEDHAPELQDYVQRGAGLFWSTLPQDDGLRRLRMDTALAQFAQNPEDRAGISARMMREAMHPPTGAGHPALIAETRELRVETPPEGGEVQALMQFAPAATVSVARPSVVAPRHVSAPSGQYQVPAVDAGLYPDAVVVAGNDGFITASGVWQDHGLASFDPSSMEPKGNATVVAVAGDRAMIRRYRDGGMIPEGIFCCGSYSRNYYHFLIETLPRAIFAARLAPAGTPILTDDDMPAQHYQALRLILPDHPILRLARHRSYQVKRLWAGSMPNSFQDAFLKADVPVDAVRVHPQILRLYADLARRLWPVSAERERLPRRLLLQRTSRWRQLLNADALIAAMARRGFEVRDPARMSFADQIRAIANADAIAGQSAAYFANIAFARPGAEVFALFSNAPGTNFNLWPVLGAPLGVRVVNVVGWRVPGSTGGAAPEAHEHFTVPPHLLTSFFPLTESSMQVGPALDALHWAGAEAEALTSAWSTVSTPTPEGFDARLLTLRRAAVAGVMEASENDLPKLLQHPLFSDPWTTLKSGLRAAAEHDAQERTAIAQVMDALVRLSDPAAAPLPAPDARRTVLLAMLLLPAWKAPLVARPETLPDDVLAHYLRWLAQSPFLFRAGEDEGYVAYCARLLDWIDRQMDDDRPAELRAAVARMAGGLDMSQLFLIEAQLIPVFAARNRVLERIAVRQGGTGRPRPRASDGSEGRVRVGVLFRTFEKGPDSEAVVAMFRAFPRDRYEVFGYSVGFKDRVVTPDPVFDREMDEAIEHRRLIANTAPEMRAQILADDLDVFVLANATTYGIQAQELALYHRVAPVQMVTNSHLPQPPGFPSFDAFFTGLSDHPDHEIDQAECPERLLRRKGPVICYMHSLKPRPNPPLDRAALGLRDEDVVMFNAGSMQKLRRECLMTMMRAVQEVPNGILMLAPYNPGWAGRAQAFAFNRQLRETAAEVGLDMAQIKVLGELTVAEAEAALSCADLYLTPFPHGGATMVHLALIYGVPPVVLRRRSSRSIDQFIVESVGLGNLLADTPDEYAALARRLGRSPEDLEKLRGHVLQAVKTPVFVDNPQYSRDIEAALADLLAQAKCHPQT